VTAEDVRYSFERVLDPRTRAPLTWVLDRIVGAKAVIAGRLKHASGIAIIDDHALAITLERPFGPFLSLLGMTTAYVVPREEVERLQEDFGSAPVGSGPYRLAEWSRGQDITLKARKDHAGGIPRLAGIRYRVIPEDLTAVMEFETGGLDVLQVPAAEYRRYTTDPRWRTLVHARPGLNTYYLGLNCSRPPFSDPQVRQAMNLAIDRERILNTLFEERGSLAAGPVPPLLWKGYREPTEPYAYDPERARSLLRAAGLDRTRIRLFISNEPEVLDIVEVVQEYLRAVGIEAKIVQLDWSAFKEAINRGDAEAFWLSWWADYPDPENFLYPLFHSANAGPAGNRAWYRDPDLDRLIEQAQATTDERARYALYARAEDRIVRNAPWVFMWHRNDISVVQPWVRDFTVYPIYSVDKGMEIAVDK
jgi:peptide/nickel transport system substrate-binding protein/oligopeptide transport system substrate-binding protein